MPPTVSLHSVALLSIVFLLCTKSNTQLVFPDEEADMTEEPCLTRNGRDGLCVPFSECQALINRVPFNRLRRHICGFNGDIPKVCCPIQRPPQPVRTPRPPPAVTPLVTARPVQTRPPPVKIEGDNPTNVSPRGNKPDILPDDCGVNKVTITKIVGGQRSELGAWPWMAALFIQTNGVWQARCGATLVTQWHILTAAHCVVDRRGNVLPSRQLRVRLGEYNIFNDNDGATPIDVNVQSVVKHENFEQRTFKNDIAVLKLENPVEFSARIKPVCLPYEALRNEDLTGRQAFVIGWGTVDFNGPASDYLLQAQISILDQEECRVAYQREVPITPVYMCAGTRDGSKDSCRGDSGGPLMSPGPDFRYYLVGIVSFGKLCGQPGFPGVYTRVTEFLDWIAANLR